MPSWNKVIQFNSVQFKEIHSNLEVLKKVPSFSSFQFPYKGHNWKLRNLGNFQLLPTKQLQVLKKFPSFPSFWFQHKGQNLKLGNLGYSQFPQINKNPLKFRSLEKISWNKKNSLKFRSLEKISEFSEFSISV